MPAQPLGWFKEEIKDASQMSGLKYRTVGLAADVLMEMGMSVVQLPGGEIQPAMKSGQTSLLAGFHHQATEQQTCPFPSKRLQPDQQSGISDRSSVKRL